MWAELVAVLVGFVILLGLALLARGPESATWSDLDAPRRVTRGQAAQLRVEVAIRGANTWVSAVGTSRQRAQPVIEWPIDTSRRGRFLVGPSRLEFADPLGIRVRTLATRELSDVHVVPRIVPVPELIRPPSTSEGLLGDRPGSEQFHSLREYAPGDPPRSVHWRSSARVGRLMVRRLVETTVPALLVVLDVDPRSYNTAPSQFDSFDTEAFEQAVDLAASCAIAHCTPAQRVLLTTTRADERVVEIVLDGREAALDWLALIEPDKAPLPGRVPALAKSRGLGHIALITGRTSALASTSRSWSQLAEVTVMVAGLDLGEMPA